MTETPATPAADAFAKTPGMTPAPAPAPAQAPAAPAAPNPFAAGDGFNLTEQGRIVRDAPEKAVELIHAAGAEKENALVLKKIGQNATKAVACSIPVEAEPGKHPAVRIAELDHISEVTYQAKDLGKEHAALLEQAAKMTPEQATTPLPVDTTFEALKFGGGDAFIRDLTPEQKTTAHRGAVAFVQSLGTVHEQQAFIAASGTLPAAVKAAFMAELAAPPRGDGKSFRARMSERLLKGENASLNSVAAVKFYDWLPQAWRDKLEQL